MDVSLGDMVVKGQEMGRLHDSFGRRLGRITAPIAGIVAGVSLDPLFNQGDAMVHVASIHDEGTQ
jgi:predicted deacylase